ncbi:MAG: flavodoxin-dependent (E)-4-hydroxy-3-methylbut-2-enyl-diphosphate synthase [candidate division Zixibacteria bacterium]|nr:flavodoxin-dependent (E)-4-hydroxy-3-methylbut-2-enyl-diphosphate synthase [candidate division Zixibacteria bacterium]MDD5424974.1 flavodoxin-dependent (E)-4-hydroxy-3-methylbut-2-enyl-diphosphate synthase [candidate division Zixibacteria bacterium]
MTGQANSVELKYPFERRKTRAVKVGNVIIGGGFPVSIQSMTNTDTKDTKATIEQVRCLFEAGCDIVRLSVPNNEAARKLKTIRSHVTGPLVADIHFQYKLALAAVDAGFDKIRINPGNIGETWKVQEVARACKEAGIPIRIGLNSGSLPRDILEKYGHDNPEAYVEAALRESRILEDMAFSDIIISLKATSTTTTFRANHLLAQKCDYPLHIGITEAGIIETGTIKSAVGIGALLLTGIGDTIRVSLTADPVKEIRVAKEILKACQLKKEGVEVIACPTCGRCRINLIDLAERITARTRHIKTPLKVAVMGCEVNGPGEAAAADIGITGGKDGGYLIKKGEKIKKITEDKLEQTLLDEIEKMTGGK